VLSSRSVILLVITLAVLSLFGMIVNLASPPDQGGLGRNTYGTHAYGQRGVYEVLDELHLPVHRGLVPPSVTVKQDVCVVFWDSDPGMVRLEPGHMLAVKEWLDAGGHVIVAPGHPEKKYKEMPTGRGTLERDTSLLGELGLPDIAITKLTTLRDKVSGKKSSVSKKDDDDTSVGNYDEFEKLITKGIKTPPQTTVPVTATGELAALKPAVAQLSVVESSLQVIDPAGEPAPVSTMTARLSDGKDWIVAADYPVGRGRVTVVSDPELFDNISLSKDADNAVLAAQLFTRAGKPVVFDEFYHGLTIRGNVFWLLTRPGYGVLFAMLCLAVGLWAWREAINLGPPLPQKAVSRRSVGEYVDAMARLFQRGNCQIASIRQIKDGVLWSVARRLGIHSKVENVEHVSAVLERRDPSAADRLRAACAGADALLNGVRTPSEVNIIETMEQLRKCL
jgi:hypothetical protein